VQSAAWVGSVGLSGLFVIIATAPLFWRQSKACALVSPLLALALFALGTLRLNHFQDTGAPHTVAIVQGNIDQSIKWDPTFQQETIARYISLSREAIRTKKADLLVWPETAMPFYLQDENTLRPPVLALVRETQVPLIVGAPAYKMLPGLNAFTLYNRAFLVDAASGLSNWYDKEHLVPFGEYMPLASILPLQKLVEGVGDFEPGVDQKPLVSGDLALGVLICYEAIFEQLAQDRVSQGASVLVNISNDAWFGATSAPLQHLQLAALRAVEQGRWLVRCTNTGISAGIDPLGRIQLLGEQFKPLFGLVDVRPRTEVTLYHRLHDALRLGYLLVTALCIGLMVLKRRHA
jgi:apolipoprotein N-acyltransferase